MSNRQVEEGEALNDLGDESVNEVRISKGFKNSQIEASSPFENYSAY